MNNAELFLYGIQIVFWGIAAFGAILLWSKTHSAALMSLTAGTIIEYVKVVYDLLIRFGLILPSKIAICGIPIASLIFTLFPPIFCITAFFIILYKNLGNANTF